MPLGPLLLAAGALQLGVFLHVDRILFRLLSIPSFYPTSLRAFASYYLVLIGTPFSLWAAARMLKRRRLIERLTQVFNAAGLKNNLGNPPRFLSDRPLDAVTRKLRVTSSVLPLAAFQKAKPALESGLQIYVDEFREIRKLGAVEVIYAHEPMPTVFQPDLSVTRKAGRFLVGATRSREVETSLMEVPHLLVAGQTGGGKSTFLRQFITSLYLAPGKARFLLVDLKGGLEFQVFEGLERVVVPDSMAKAVTLLADVAKEVETRMQLLKAGRAKDVEAYRRSAKERGDKLPDLSRQIIVIDEAAEMFLAGQHASGANVQLAKRVLSQVARQGRSLGIHLVVATQRPDSRALDPQIKANLPGVLCFQMVNDISSITVLGNGRATDLPSVPGRAIWKTGAEMVEVQTPLLTPQRAEELLRPFRKEQPASSASLVDPKPELRRLAPKEKA
jgi:S-DNA-T family DNA segregation ATPase FtsK/SpoIIIE